MIRPITCVAVLMACASGYYVYDVSHQVSLLDRQIEQTLQQTGSVRERIRMLHAEWTVRNRPERLQRLSDQYLSLEPTRPEQFVSLADLADRLPPPVPAAPAAGPAIAGGPLQASPTPDAGMVAGGTGVAGTGTVVAEATSGTGATGGAMPLPAGAPAAAVAVAPAASSSAGDAAVGPSAPARPLPAATVHLAAAPAAAPVALSHPSSARLAADAVHATPGPPAAGHAPLARPRLTAAAQRPAQHPRVWAPPRPAPVHLVAARYRAPAYRLPPRPQAGGSLLGMAHTYAAGPLAPPAPMPMPYGPGGGGG